MTNRRDVLGEIEKHIDKNGIYPLSVGGRNKALSGLERARKTYEDARREVLKYELAMFYRVAIFGSARLRQESPEFQFVTDLSKALVEARDVDIVTGGGPGVMEAANLGTRLAITGAINGNGRKLRARNLGETITLTAEEKPNEHLDIVRKHPEFSTRLQAFADKTRAAYNAPGGIGTLFEMLLMVQTRQVGHLEKSYPILAHPYWEPVVNAWNDAMYHNRDGQPELISGGDLSLVRFSSNIDEIVGVVSKDYDKWHRDMRRKVRLVK